jgi:hypothetical protein
MRKLSLGGFVLLWKMEMRSFILSEGGMVRLLWTPHSTPCQHSSRVRVCQGPSEVMEMHVGGRFGLQPSAGIDRASTYGQTDSTNAIDAVVDQPPPTLLGPELSEVSSPRDADRGTIVDRCSMENSSYLPLWLDRGTSHAARARSHGFDLRAMHRPSPQLTSSPG